MALKTQGRVMNTCEMREGRKGDIERRTFPQILRISALIGLIHCSDNC